MGQAVKTLPRCDACQEREACIIGDLPPAQQDAYTRVRHLHYYKAHQIIFHEGTPALGFHIGCSGRIKLSKADRDGRGQILRIGRPGEIIGEEAMLSGQRYDTTAEPLEDCHTAFIRREDFLTLVEAGNGTASRLLLHFCRTLIEMQGRLARMGLGDARARLAGTLLDLANHHGRANKGGVELGIELSRAELAAMAGLTPETAIRILGEFKGEGLLHLDGRRITVTNRDRLASLVGF